MRTLLKNKRWNRILGKILLLCLVVNTIMDHGNLYAYAGNQTDIPLHKTISVTEKKINKAFERYDGEEIEIKNSVIPFKGPQKEQARETLESILFGMVIVSQSRLGDNCTAIVAARSNDEYGDGASIDEVMLIGLNGNADRDCEFTLEIVSEGGITAGAATVTGYRAEDFEEEKASDSDADQKASPSDAKKQATPSNAKAAAGNQPKAEQAGKSQTEKKTGTADSKSSQSSLATPSTATGIPTASSGNAGSTEEAEEDDTAAGEPFEEYYTREWKKNQLAGLVIQKEGILESISRLLSGEAEEQETQEDHADHTDHAEHETPEPPTALSRSGDITAVNVVMEEARSEDNFAHFSITAASDQVQAGEWMEFLAAGSVDPVETIRGISGKAYFTLRFEPDEEAEGEEYIEQMEGPEVFDETAEKTTQVSNGAEVIEKVETETNAAENNPAESDGAEADAAEAAADGVNTADAGTAETPVPMRRAARAAAPAENQAEAADEALTESTAINQPEKEAEPVTTLAPEPTIVTGASEELDKITGYLMEDTERYPLEDGESWKQQSWYQIPSQEDESQYYYYNPQQRLAVIPIETGQTSELSIPFAYPAQLTPDGAALTAYAEYLNADEIIKSGPGAVGYVEEGEARIQNTAVALAANEEQNILTYAEEKEGAETRVTIVDENGDIITAVDGTYQVTAGRPYQVKLTFASKAGMEPGRYYFPFPTETALNAAGGKLELKDKTTGNLVEIGTWSIDSQNRLIFDINENITNFTAITLGATVNVQFKQTEGPYELEWDGTYSVIVTPEVVETETEVHKRKRNADPNKIYWQVEIKGKSNSKIVGSTITDTIDDTSTHYYSPDDMENGIEIQAYRYSDYQYGNDLEGHKWIVQPGDGNLTWTESGWSYTMPESVYCEWCKETKKLGNDKWIYYLYYTSTKKVEGSYGQIVSYKNQVEVDGESATGRAESGEPIGDAGEINKVGQYNSETDTISWTITATIPGSAEGEKYNYFWHLWDQMSLIKGNTKEPIENNLNNATVKAIVGGKEIIVPNVSDAKGEEPFIWSSTHWENQDGKQEGVPSGRQMDLYSKCTCTRETCQLWNEEKNCCGAMMGKKEGYCRCWCTKDDVAFTFTYTTDAKKLFETYTEGGVGVSNTVYLRNKQLENGKWKTKTKDQDTSKVAIPGTFSKALTHDPDGTNNYSAEFTVTINESMKDMAKMTTDGRIVVEDIMSDTLIFQPSSLVITTEDSEGHIQPLTSVIDYHVIPSGNKVQIVLLKLGAYKYTLTYRASIYVEAGSAADRYKNQASVTLGANKYFSEIDERMIPDVVASGEKHSVTLIKTDQNDTEKRLEGAVFGLYASNGNEICVRTTDQEGKISVSTDTSKEIKILFYEHVDYYFQELTAPEGYVLDPTKHYFRFCNAGADCDTCKEYQAEHKNVTIIYGESDSMERNSITVTNTRMGPELPNTGGPGTDWHHRAGLTMMLSALIMLAGYTLEKQKRKRRG